MPKAAKVDIKRHFLKVSPAVLRDRKTRAGKPNKNGHTCWHVGHNKYRFGYMQPKILRDREDGITYVFGTDVHYGCWVEQQFSADEAYHIVEIFDDIVADLATVEKEASKLFDTTDFPPDEPAPEDGGN